MKQPTQPAIAARRHPRAAVGDAVTAARQPRMQPLAQSQVQPHTQSKVPGQPHAQPRSVPRPRRCAGFTLVESIVVMLLLAGAAGAILAMVPKLRQTQDPARDEVAGQMLMNACAERLLAIRRSLGFSQVGNAACNGMGGVAGFAANPTVSIVNGAGTTLTACSVDFNTVANRTCRATISITRSTGLPVRLVPIILQMSFY